MGVAALGLVTTCQRVNAEWEALSPEQRKTDEEFSLKHKIYRSRVRVDFLKTVEQFGVWAQKSSGFSIR